MEIVSHTPLAAFIFIFQRKDDRLLRDPSVLFGAQSIDLQSTCAVAFLLSVTTFAADVDVQ